MHRSSLPSFEPAIFPPRPGSQGLVEMTQDLHTFGAIKSPVVVHPATHHWVDDPRQILQRLVVPCGSQVPVTDLSTDHLGRLDAHRWKEASKELAPAISGTSRLEGITQERERDLLVRSRPIIILAVNDPGLRWM